MRSVQVTSWKTLIRREFRRVSYRRLQENTGLVPLS
jgi:hypothetical protein